MRTRDTVSQDPPPRGGSGLEWPPVHSRAEDQEQVGGIIILFSRTQGSTPATKQLQGHFTANDKSKMREGLSSHSRQPAVGQQTGSNSAERQEHETTQTLFW